MGEYLPLLVLIAMAALLPALLLTLPKFLSHSHPTPEKIIPFESGVNPVGSAREPFSVRFFLVAVLFILFDIEVVFLYPWAILFRRFVAEGAGMLLLMEMAVFIGILVVGLVYVWKKGALEWE